MDLHRDPNPARAKAGFDAMMKMKKIDIATIQTAADAAG
jgi:predicted 3-demethylubiquinone-9 3-methyltransferase (glyoxalase superfamily)